MTNTIAVDLSDALRRWELLTPRAPRTKEGYRYALARFAREGIATTADATVERLTEWLTRRLESGASPQTANGDLAGLYAALGIEVRAGRFSRKLLRQLRSLKIHLRRPRQLSARFLSPDEITRAQRLARELDQQERPALNRAGPRGPHYRDHEFLLRFALLTGMRGGEIARCRWSEIDLGERPSISVRIRPELGQAGRCKTGERKVPVCSALREILLARRAELGVSPGEDGYLFPQRSEHRGAGVLGGFRSIRALRRQLERLRPVAADLDFHVCRHTRASTWAQAGVPLVKVALWLGHSVEVCARFYSGLAEGYDPDCERSSVA